MPHRNWLPKMKYLEDRWPFILLALLISLLVISTSGLLGAEYDDRYTVMKGKVISANDSKLSPDPYVDGMMIGVQPVTIELLSGSHKGEQFEITNVMSRAFNIYCQENMVILCNVREENGIVSGLDVFGYNRDTFIYGFLALFFALLLFVGRKKGLYSVLSLMFTLIVIVFFMIPRILDGWSPILAALITAALTAFITTFLVSGINEKSYAAIVGVVLGVASAGIVSYVAGVIGNVSGIHLPEAEEMIYLAQDIPIRVPELLFAGIIIAALGAIMDVGMSISSAVFEVSAANEKLGMRELYQSGMNIGRDVMGTMSNTLILAFAGSSMTVLIIIVLYQLPYLRMINLDLVGIELIQGISGSVGLVLTMPITAVCAAFLAARTGKGPGGPATDKTTKKARAKQNAPRR